MTIQLLISQGEACRRLGVSRPTLIREIEAGRLRYVLIGRRRKFKPGELEAYVERQVQGWDGTDTRRRGGMGQRAGISRSRSGENSFEEALRMTARRSSRSTT